MNRLRQKYHQEIVPALKKTLHLSSDMAVPRLTKIVLNMGIKEGAGDKGVVQKIADYVSLIAGQKAIVTRARKAEAAFKIQKNDPIGVKATLRGDRLYAFLDKFIAVVLPQVRDFQGIPRDGFDGRGNYSLGVKEQIIFPELDYDTIDTVRGLQITLVTNTENDQTALQLLTLLGLPFAKPDAEK